LARELAMKKNNVLKKLTPDQPWHEFIAQKLPTLKNQKERLSVAKRREDIVALYDKVRFSS
jgi:hypothetical protein